MINNNFLKNKKLDYIILAFIISIIVIISIYYFYNSITIKPTSNLNISQNINSSINQNYNSPFPSSIGGFERIKIQPIKNQLPKKYSINLINKSFSVFENPKNNETIAIYQMIYSNNTSSNNIFKEIVSIIPLSSRQLPNLIILKNLPANYYGVSSISSNKTIYSLIALNNSKICSVFFDSEAHTSNTIIKVLENTTRICFKV